MTEARTQAKRVSPLLAAFALCACSGSPRQEPSVPQERTNVPPAPAQPAGTPDCKFVAREQCFATSTAACAALACPPERCDWSYSLPPQANCR